MAISIILDSIIISITALVTKIIKTPVTALDANIAQGTTDPEAALTNSNYLLSAMPIADD